MTQTFDASAGLAARRVLLTAVLGLSAPGLAAAQGGSPSPMLVVPFEIAKTDGQPVWMREGAAILLTDALTARGEAAVARDERLHAFDRLQIPPLASLSRASVIKVGQTVGAVAIVIGNIDGANAELIVRARTIRLDTGRLSPEVSAKAASGDLIGAVDQLAQQLAVSAQPGAAPAQSWRPPSARTFESYVKGLIAEAAAARVTAFEQALKASPAYERARLALWQVHTDAGDHQKALATIGATIPGRTLGREARFLAALSRMHLKQFDEALLALRDLQGEQPAASIANAIGVLELRRSATPQPGRATYYFSQATDLDAADGDLFFNLGYAYWIADRDARAAIYWLREAVRRDPADGDAHFVLAMALQQTGAAPEAARERELAMRLSSRYSTVEAKTAGGADQTPRGLERLHDHLISSPSRVDALASTAGQRDHNELARFHLEAGRRAFARDADREAVTALRRALYLSPYLADAHVLMGRIHLSAGRVDEAIEALKIALWSDETAAAHVLLAEAYLHAQDTAAAKAEVDRALALDPASADAQRLKAKLATSPW